MLFLTNIVQMQHANTRSSDAVRGASNVSVVLYGVLDIFDCVCYYQCVN